MSKTCRIEGCDAPLVARGLCNRHYVRVRKHGDPMVTRCDQSNRGRPLSWMRDVALVFDGDGCLEFPYSKSNGYGQFWHNGRLWKAHRWVCQMTHGKPPKERMAAAHFCGNRSCVNPRHIRWATYAENNDDKIAHGTLGSKLSESEVRAILRDSRSHKLIAADFGISRAMVSHIKRRDAWAHVREATA